MEKGKWDLPDFIAALIGLFAVFRGHVPEAVTKLGGDADDHRKSVSGLKAMFSKEDEGIWVSLLATLEAPQQRAITLVLERLTGVNEVDSFRLAVVNAPNITITEETRDPAKPKVVVKKVTKAAEFCGEDNRVKFLKAIAALETSVAVNLLRTHKIATENVVTKYGPALLNQLTAAISNRKKDTWRDILRRVPIDLWIMGSVTVLGIIAIVIKIHFVD